MHSGCAGWLAGDQVCFCVLETRMQVTRRQPLAAVPVASRATTVAPLAKARVDAFTTTAVAAVSPVPAPPRPPFTLPTSGQYTTDTATGRRADPVTFYVHGSLQDVENALTAGGWTKADPKDFSHSLKY